MHSGPHLTPIPVTPFYYKWKTNNDMYTGYNFECMVTDDAVSVQTEIIFRHFLTLLKF